MKTEPKRPGGMRVLLRHGEEYLQPSGDWSPDKEHARVFESGIIAYYWALELRLLGVEVLLAFDDTKYDFVPLRT